MGQSNKQTDILVPPPHSVQDLQGIVDSPDLFRVAIKGHQAIDIALANLIVEALPNPHRVEVMRISFLLKIDLAIGLSVLEADSRPLFAYLNKIRNCFAHDPEASFNAQDLANALSPFQRYLLGCQADGMQPHDLLGCAIGIAQIQAVGSAERIRDSKLYGEVMHEMVVKLRGDRPVKRDDPCRSKVDEEIRRRFEAKKREAEIQSSPRDEHEDLNSTEIVTE